MRENSSRLCQGLVIQSTGEAVLRKPIGERVIDGEARASMLRVAEQCEELGRKAEWRRIAKLKLIPRVYFAFGPSFFGFGTL
jgi:hypothetical protein